jgi:isopenicillin N synthase-like dioxygenase
MSGDFSTLPIIDVSALVTRTGDTTKTADQLALACRKSGFFYITGHAVSEDLQSRLEDLSRDFFRLPADAKLSIDMSKGGKAWRGYFPVGGELTSGKPDLKEGLYFGQELSPDHPLVRSSTPMHGPNLFPESNPLFRATVLEYLDAMTKLGHALVEGIALSLGLESSYFADRYTREPLTLFRIFHYPAATQTESESRSWGVGEHTDYGLLTILKQDETGGLEVKSSTGWIEALPVPGTFICNIGDMLDRMTGGIYRSTPHRVKSPIDHDRFSFPFFFDPNFNSEVQPIEMGSIVDDDRDQRWDHASVHEFRGTYGEYLQDKVARVFPQLRREVMD